MKKIAPNLNQLIEEASKLGLGYWPDKCRKELRALLAVARAARSVLKVDGDGSNTEVPTDYWGVLKNLRVASARLDKVSTGRAGKGER